jgi:hypothetical protein
LRELIATHIRHACRLRIHCWGGLGSQLFAWAVVEELLLSQFSRQIELILHTSGVTRRDSELERLGKYVKVTQIHDFTLPTKNVDQYVKFGLNKIAQKLTKKLLRQTLFSLGIFTEFKNQTRPLPWTFVLRGHYSHRLIRQETILNMHKRFSDEGLLVDSLEPNVEAISIHYRLGDLLSLDEKTYVPPRDVILAVSKISGGENLKIDVFSDSPNVAVDLLSSRSDGSRILGKNLLPWETISELLRYRHFVGTNSKISIWVCLFRSTGFINGGTFIPAQLRDNISHNLGGGLAESGIVFY